MTRNSLTASRAVVPIIGALGAVACSADGLPAKDTASSDSALVAIDPATNEYGLRFWTNGEIHICYQNVASGNVAQRFEDTLRETWGAIANLTFYFDGDCNDPGFSPPPSGDYVSVTFIPEPFWAVSGGFGQGALKPNGGEIHYCDPTGDFDGDSIPVSVDCNDKDSNIGGNCPAVGTARVYDCSYAIEQERATAVHEFGHALGFFHEQQNPLRPSNLLDWCTWVEEPAYVAPSGVEQGALCYDGQDNDGDGLKDCADTAGCQGICGWDGWFLNSGLVGRDNTIVSPYTGELRWHDALVLTKWDPQSAVTYCPETDGIFDYDGNGIIEPIMDGELVDNRKGPLISASNTAAIQLIYGIKGESIYAAGGLHASSGFEIDGTWVVASASTLEPEWRDDGLVDSAFQNPFWRRSFINIGTGVELDATQLGENTVESITFRFRDFMGRSRFARQSIERNDSKYMSIITAMM